MKNISKEIKQALLTFEPPRPREITYGVAARLFEHSRLSSSRALHRYLFGYSTTELASRIPGGLRELFRRLPGVWANPKSVVDLHTIYPLFRLFESSAASARRIESLLIHARKSPGQRVRRMFELAPGDASEEKRFAPRYCIDCALDELRKGRRPTWYRDHQIPGANYCAKHAVYLSEDCYACGDLLFRHRYVLPPFHSECAQLRPALFLSGQAPKARFPALGRLGLKPEDRVDRAELRVSRFVVGLLEKNLDPIFPSEWLHTLQIGVRRRGRIAAIREIRRADFVGRGAVTDLLCGPMTSLIRAASMGAAETAQFLELSIKERMQITSVVFESVDLFLSALRAVER